jgi:peptidoglycan/LPS O-acetylase OafA/YrhL
VAAGTGRYDYLDGLRAVAIGAVLGLHWLSWYVPLFHGGSIGVDVFFVLSGFIITTMLWRAPGHRSVRAGWAAFVRRRVARLYPAVLGLVVVSVALFALVPFAPLHPLQLLDRGALVLAQASALWAAGLDGSLWLPALQPFGQTWSLAIEWYFYLLWPLVVLGARTRSWTAGRLATASLITALVLYAGSLPLGVFWFYFGPTARFAEILVGCALALWFQAGGVPRRSPTFVSRASVLALAALAAYTLLAPGAASPVYRLVGIPVAVLATATLIVAGYSGSAGPVHRLLSHPWLAGLGRASYSLYLWHVVPLLLFEDAWPSWPKPVLGAMVLASTALLTAASYHFLERPFLRPRSDVLSPASTPRSTSAVTRSSAAVRVGFRPIRLAASARQSAPYLPPASRSARNAPNAGLLRPTTSPGAQSSTSEGNSARS